MISPLMIIAVAAMLTCGYFRLSIAQIQDPSALTDVVRADLRYAGASPQASLGTLAMKPEGVASIPTELVMLAIAIILNPDVPACA